ncbi:MAG: hypothetical protein O2968_08315 [Acidobacteria bacterium]|nr:hypothetical protein [Acidobacteriota bacterium]
MKRETDTAKAPRWTTVARLVCLWLSLGATLQAATTPNPNMMAISPGQTVDGVLEASDDRTRLEDGSFADNYVLTLATAQTVTIDMSSDTFETFLVVFDSAEDFVGLADDTDANGNSRLEIALPAGTFFIEATTFNPGDSGPYTLWVSLDGLPPPPPPPPPPTPLPTRISLGDIVDGVLEASDARSRAGDGSFADNFQLTLDTAQTVIIEMNSTAFDTYLFVFDGVGNLVAPDDDGGTGTNSRLELALPPGTFIIEATSSAPGDDGAYTLSVSGKVEPPPPPTPISLGETVDGELEEADARTRSGDGAFADNYELTLATPQTITIEMNSAAFDAFLSVYDSDDNLVASNDDGGKGAGSLLELALPAGTFFVEATSLAPRDDGPYTLSVSVTEPPIEQQITGVFDAAGGQALISPGAIVSVFGNFVEITATASSVPLAENLAGFSVTFNGIPGALFGVFDDAFDQSNVQVLWNVDVSSGKVEVKVHWQDDTTEVWSDPFEADAASASPGIYMHPPLTTRAIVTNFKQPGDDVIADSWAQPLGSIPGVVTQPAAIGGVATIWSNGLGRVSPLPATGNIPPPGTVPFTEEIVRVFVGDVEAQVLGAVLQPTSVGLNQINIIIPEGVTPGDAVPIVIEVECDADTKIRSREDATIAVRAAP